MSWLLADHLKALLAAEFSETVLREPGNPERYAVPRVYIGALPNKRRSKPGAEDPGEDFPFIVVRPISGQDGESEGARFRQADMMILCGVYVDGDESAGCQEVEAMVARVRRVLLERWQFGKGWTLQPPVSWTFGDGEDHQHPHPYYMAQARASFRAPGIMQLTTPEEEVRVYGALE